jgi:hypothetical protein
MTERDTTHPTITRRSARAAAKRRRVAFITGGAAALAIAGSAVAVTTNPAVGEAVGMPSASATTTPALRGHSLDEAQAQATIATAQDVAAHAVDGVSTTDLDHQIASLGHYDRMSGGKLRDQIETTVNSATKVSDANVTKTREVAQQKAEAAKAAAAAKAQQAAEAAKAAAEAKARAAEAARQAAASTPEAAKATAAQLASSQYGWGTDQFSCLNSLWTKESGWNVHAVNPNGGATGIPQALPGSKMATIAPDWQTNATTQITWGLQYIKSSYGTPCAAWGHSQATNYY